MALGLFAGLIFSGIFFLTRTGWMQRIIGFYFFYSLAVAYINYYVYGYNEAETAPAQSSRQDIVAQFFQEEPPFDQRLSSLDQKNTGRTSLQGQIFFTKNLWRNGSVSDRRCLPLALSMQQAQQENTYTLSAVQAALDSRYEAQHPTCLCLACRGGSSTMEPVGIARSGPTETQTITQQKPAFEERKGKGTIGWTRTAAIAVCDPHGHPALAVTRSWLCRKSTDDQSLSKYSLLGKPDRSSPSTSERPFDRREEAVSRHDQGADRSARSSGEGRGVQFSKDWCRPAPHFVPDQQGYQAIESTARSTKPTQGTMASPPPGLNQSLGKSDEKLSGTTEAIHRSNQQSKGRTVSSSKAPADPQQASRIADKCQNGGARDSGAGGWSSRDGRHRGSSIQASSGLPETSSSHSQSRRCPRRHGIRRRRSGWSTQVQKTAFFGAIWASSYACNAYEWGDRNSYVSWGDGAECLRNFLHAPGQDGWRDGPTAEAYAMDAPWCAARSEPSLDHTTMCLILCHSIRWDDRFMPSFVSTKRAIDLQYEVSNNLLLEGHESIHHDPFPRWPVFGSILKTSKIKTRKTVTFQADDDPLSYGAVSISDLQNRISDHEVDPAWVPTLGGPQPQPHGPEDMPPVPNFVQDVFAQFEAVGTQADVLLHDGFVARTWYLHHQVFPRWRVPRFIELDHDWSRWRDEIANAWRDMIDRSTQFHLTVVQPDPYRQYLNRRADVDIILSQEAEPGLFAGFLTVTQSRVDSLRTFAIAVSLPERVSGLQIIRSADLSGLLATSTCHLSFRWDLLQLDDTADHEMHDGHGFQLNCRPPIEPPVTDAQNSTDLVTFMQGQIIRTKRPLTHNEPDAPAWYPHINAQGGHAELNNQLLRDEEPDAHPAEDVGDESPRSEDPFVHPPDDDESRQAVIMFHLVDDPIHAMLDWTDWPRMIREIAYHYAVDREEVLECHELNVRLPDIPQGIVPIIVQQVQDVPVGTAYVFILIDVETHGHWMEAHYGTAPLVERRVVAVPALLTRTALLSQARVFEYCRFEKDRCLIEYNHRNCIKQDPAPKRALFGDYAKILLPPSLKCDASTGEMLADSRQLTVEDFWSRYFIPSTPESSF